MEAPPTDYSSWSHESLVTRATELEKQLKEQTLKARLPSPRPQRPRTRPKRAFDPSKYSTRFIALKFAYLGQRYNGFEYHVNNHTALPTIEEVLWRALRKARLIIPENVSESEPTGDEEISWEGCEYSKCGRTDRGVSAFGQVIGLRVRSNRPLARDKVRSGSQRESLTETAADLFGEGLFSTSADVATQASDSDDVLAFDDISNEIQYPKALNRILPDDIRVLAWCPSPPPGFSARFSCKERRYRYYFTQPAFAPTPGILSLSSIGSDEGAFKGQECMEETQADQRHDQPLAKPRRRREGWLDIGAMKLAAQSFIGTHDFRNFCKVDPSKQITNFRRRIFHADIIEIDAKGGPVGYVGRPEYAALESPSSSSNVKDECNGNLSGTTGPPRVYVFEVHGTAFLWHQVRHMAAILFLIGQGLESPPLVSQLLDTTVMTRKPAYEMAADAPLVLWDCLFSSDPDSNSVDALEWIPVGDRDGVTAPSSASEDFKYGENGLINTLWASWRRRKMDELLIGSLLDVVADQTARKGNLRDDVEQNEAMEAKRSQKLFAGGDGPRLVGRYIPVLERPRLETVEVINQRFIDRKEALTREVMNGED